MAFTLHPLSLFSSDTSSVSSYAPFLIAVAVILFSYRFINYFVLRPVALRRALLDQGIDVKPYRFPAGDILEEMSLKTQTRKDPISSPSDHHLVFNYQFPLYHKRICEINSQGSGCAYNDRPFVVWEGNFPIVVLTNPDDVKTAMSSEEKHFQIPQDTHDNLQELLGNDGLLLSDGEQWHIHRNLLRPAFFMDKLKEMVPAMVASALEMVDAWNKRLNKDGQPTELEIAKDLKDATGDIIARTSFGSSYIQGKSVFEKQVQILELIWSLLVKRNVIPGYRYFPTANNRKLRNLEKAVKHELSQIVESHRLKIRSHSDEPKTDLLGLMLTAEEHNIKQGTRTIRLTTEQIIDECRTFFFAGHETTANLLAWTMVLLSLHPEWQERAREEVLELCGKGEPKAEHLNKMKILTMVFNETLRLYPPVPEYGRRIVRPNKGGFKLGDKTLPEGTCITVLSLYFHRRKDLWGDDADEFNPERFADGVSKACKHPSGFMPFGQGPRICIGQNFALMEAKVLMTAILQRFHFSLSPNYRHAPITTLTMRPRYGVQCILKPLL